MNRVLKEFFLGNSHDKGVTANLISLRWAFILIVFPIAFLITENVVSFENFIIVEMLAFIYNSMVTLIIINKSDKKRKLSDLIFYLDIILVLSTIYTLGGLQTDIYFAIFFILCYFGLLNSFKNFIIITSFSLILYSTICIYMGGSNFNYWMLLERDVMFIIVALGMFFISTEFNKYNELHEKEFKLARTDKLTGLANRHCLDQRLNEEVSHAMASGNPINVLIFDIDNFKKFNDTYGHIWGDKLLTLFSDIIRQGIRKNDIAIRYGGEEFLIVIRDLDLAIARKVADRIRSELEKQKIFVGKDEDRKRVTVSCGVAQYPKHSLNIKEAIDLADKALYMAKDTGKNRVVCYDDVMDVQKIG